MSQLTTLLHSLQGILSEVNHHDQQELKHSIDALTTEGQLHQKSSWAAHMTPSVTSPALLGTLLAGVHNGNLLSPDLYPDLVAIESELISWFCQLFKQNAGHFTHGSSYANLEALWQARDKSTGDSKIVYGSKAVHYSIPKACQILGLDFQPIPTNQYGQIDTASLRLACQNKQPVAIIATLGTSSCGAIDAISECTAIASQNDSWCHIDAAWGGALALLESHPDLIGIENADSICFDPHKTLGQPKPASILLYKVPLKPISDLDVDYLDNTPKQTLIGSYGGELFIPLWLTLKLSKKSLHQSLKQRLDEAALFANELEKHSSWQIFPSPTGIICFKPAINTDLSPLLHQGVFSQAKINDTPVYRAVFSNETTKAQQLITLLRPYF